MTRGLWAAFAAGLVLRAVVANWTPVPAEDAANYLWMARAFAMGDATRALAEVFPPGFPLLLAGPLTLSGAEDPVAAFRMAQWINVLLGALAVWPIAWLARNLAGLGPWRTDQQGAALVGVVAGWLTATGSLFTRTATDVLSEPAFVLFGAMALLQCVRPSTGDPARGGGLGTNRALGFGLWSAAAVWVRPEGVALPLGFAAAWAWGRIRRWNREPQGSQFGGFHQVLAAGLPSVLALIGLVVWRHSLGLESEWLAKWDFHEARVLPDKGDIPGNLLRVPWALAEAFGPLILGVVLWPVVKGRLCPVVEKRPGRDLPKAVLLAVAGFALAAIVTFVVRRRFFISWTPLVVPVAAMGWCALLGAVRGTTAVEPNQNPARDRRWLPWVVGLIGCVGVVTAWRGRIDSDRVAERDLGRWMAERLAPGEQLVTDMTRVRYFANLRPLAPRRHHAHEMLAAAQAPEVAAVVVAVRREGRAEMAALLQPVFEPAVLPDSLQAALQARGLVALTRSP